MRTALITGITGQDGSYLAELLLAKGYHVIGMQRPGSPSGARIAHLVDKIELVTADVQNSETVADVIGGLRPDEVYNLAAQSSAQASWDNALQTAQTTALAVTGLLEAVRTRSSNTRFYQAGSSEQFGNASSSPQNEATPFQPGTPYGSAKCYAHWMTRSYRESRGLYTACGILFNHESPRRDTRFVTRKITDAVARISLGLAERVTLGNLDSRRDWGFAGEYVETMWLMLQQPDPRDFVVGTGVSHSVRDFCELAFSAVGLDYRDHVTQDPALFRQSEPRPLVADPSAIKETLGWSATTGLAELVRMMVEADLERLKVPVA